MPTAPLQITQEMLLEAIEGDQFRVYYQPIVKPGVKGAQKAEALIRWQHPERGLIGPNEFIPSAETHGLIGEIGEWVFRQAAQQAQEWRRTLHHEFKISVNRSAIQFQDPQGAEKSVSYLEEHGLPNDCIVLEITEGHLLGDHALILEQLNTFRANKLAVAVDDFGTGYSALSYLRKFRPEFLKIDRSFVQYIEKEQFDQAMVETIVELAHRLGITVIAEGVETEAQQEFLVKFNCDFAQGYLYSKAVPAADFENWFHNSME